MDGLMLLLQLLFPFVTLAVGIFIGILIEHNWSDDE